MKSNKEEIIKDEEGSYINNNQPNNNLEDLLSQKNNELNKLYDDYMNKLKETMNLFPRPPGRLMKAWLWFQKYAFTSIIFIVLGITLGIGIEKISNHNQMIKAINLQRYEFKGDIFEIYHSSIKKYYINGEKNITSIISPQKEKEVKQ
jgi:hypothetical protein